MKGKSRRPGIEVADASQEQRRQELTGGDAAAKLLDHHFGASLTRRPLDEGNQRLDLWSELYDVGSDFGIGTAEQKSRGKHIAQAVKDLTPGEWRHGYTSVAAMIRQSAISHRSPPCPIALRLRLMSIS